MLRARPPYDASVSLSDGSETVNLNHSSSRSPSRSSSSTASSVEFIERAIERQSRIDAGIGSE